VSSGTTVGEVVCATAVSSDLRRREKKPMVDDSETCRRGKEKKQASLQRRAVREASETATTETQANDAKSEEDAKRLVD
jgi:hypothetical protein